MYSYSGSTIYTYNPNDYILVDILSQNGHFFTLSYSFLMHYRCPGVLQQDVNTQAKSLTFLLHFLQYLRPV